MQGRTKSGRPAFNLFGVCGSAISCRAQPIMSASPVRSRSSPRCGGVIRPNAMTGSRVAFFSARLRRSKSDAVTAAGGISIQKLENEPASALK